MVDIQDIVQDIISRIDKRVDVHYISDQIDNDVRIYVCELKWLQIGSIIKDNQGRTATVTLVGENYIEVTTDDFVWDGKYFTIEKDIFYFRGTPKATNQEWLYYTKNENLKTPFIWLVEPTPETFYGAKSNLERKSDLRMFFLDSTNYEKFTVKQHHDNVLKYLYAWIDGFKDVIIKDRGFLYVEEWNTRALSKFGVETDSGVDNNIIDSNLSAIELRFSLSIKNGAKCLCLKPIIKTYALFSGEDILISDDNEILVYG